MLSKVLGVFLQFGYIMHVKVTFNQKVWEFENFFNQKNKKDAFWPELYTEFDPICKYFSRLFQKKSKITLHNVYQQIQYSPILMDL